MVVIPEPADVKIDAVGPKVIISEGAKEKISVAKIIMFCGYLP